MHHPSTLDPDHPPRHPLANHIGGHDAATGAGEGQEEEGRRAQEASSTNQWVSPGVGAAEAAADMEVVLVSTDTEKEVVLVVEDLATSILPRALNIIQKVVY